MDFGGILGRLLEQVHGVLIEELVPLLCQVVFINFRFALMCNKNLVVTNGINCVSVVSGNGIGD